MGFILFLHFLIFSIGFKAKGGQELNYIVLKVDSGFSIFGSFVLYLSIYIVSICATCILHFAFNQNALFGNF